MSDRAEMVVWAEESPEELSRRRSLDRARTSSGSRAPHHPHVTNKKELLSALYHIVQELSGYAEPAEEVYAALNSLDVSRSHPYEEYRETIDRRPGFSRSQETPIEVTLRFTIMPGTR